MATVRVKIEKYDASVRKPPFRFITLAEDVVFDDPETDDLGQERYRRMFDLCKERGYSLRFYSLGSDLGHKYNIVVSGEFELCEDFLAGRL
jgi:hypothetical protein